MAYLRVRGPQGTVRELALQKRITSLGRGAENDVALAEPSLPETALHIHFDGRDYTSPATAARS